MQDKVKTVKILIWMENQSLHRITLTIFMNMVNIQDRERKEGIL